MYRTIVAATSAVAVLALIATLHNPVPPRQPAPAGPSFIDVAIQAMECPPDLRGCTTPREHVRNFKAGNYGYARKDILYGRMIKRRMLDVARAVFRRRGMHWEGNRVEWREYIVIDRCIVSTYGTRTNTCIQQQNEDFKRYNVVLKKVMVCGSMFIPIFRIKGLTDKLLTAIPGGVVCPWTYVDEDV